MNEIYNVRLYQATNFLNAPRSTEDSTAAHEARLDRTVFAALATSEKSRALPPLSHIPAAWCAGIQSVLVAWSGQCQLAGCFGMK